MLIDHAIRKRGQMKQQRARNVVRQITDNAQRRLLARRGQRAEVERERVACMQFEQIAELRLETPDQIAVEFDRVQRRVGRGEPLDQRLGERAEPWADFDHTLAALRPDHVDDRIDHAHVDQKILTETLARDMTLVPALLLSAGGHRRNAKERELLEEKELAPSAPASGNTVGAR